MKNEEFAAALNFSERGVCLLSAFMAAANSSFFTLHSSFLLFLLVKLHFFLHTPKHFPHFFFRKAQIKSQNMLCNTKESLHLAAKALFLSQKHLLA